MNRVRSRTPLGHAVVRVSKADQSFARGLARAYGGAVIFSLPLMMTMEMWWLGFYMSPLRLGLLIVLLIPVLVALSHLAGFEETFRWQDDLLDAFVAYAVGFSAAAVLLLLFAVIDVAMSADEIVGKISLQAVPGSIGAMLAQSLMGERKAGAERGPRAERYLREVFLMGIGALFLAFNVAPTEEMVLISYQMTAWHAVLLALLSVVIMHAFVYAVQFYGQHGRRPGRAPFSTVVHYTLVGYALALVISWYVLWTFGRTEGVSAEHVVMMMFVLGFPAAVGAAAARLIL